MLKRALAVLLAAAAVGLNTVFFATLTLKTAHAQSDSCPPTWFATNCITMPPPDNDTITTAFQLGGSGFNTSDPWCSELYADFESAYTNGHVVVGDFTGTEVGGFYGDPGFGTAKLGIANSQFGRGNAYLPLSTAIHEEAHDWGCSDDRNDPASAYAWEGYCVPTSSPGPPPPQPCSLM